MRPRLQIDPASGLAFRAYGASGRPVILVHGGPGAPGSLAAVARGLAGAGRLLEPLQRRSGDAPLTVAAHVADLESFVRSRVAGPPPLVLGHSWGAMLALAHAAAHPRSVAGVLAVGCGTFDREARGVLEARRRRALDAPRRRAVERVLREVTDPDARLALLGRLYLPVDSFALASEELELDPCDARGHEETWADMLRLQAQGVYPAALSAIECPVLLLHGREDPHPGRRIRDGLLPYVRHLAYRELERCGHYPWLEEAARQRFFAVALGWIERTGSAPRPERGGEAR